MQNQVNGIFRIGSYQGNRQRVLGKGATGCVYSGIKLQTCEPVAIKVIAMSQVNNEVTQYLLDGEKKSMTTIANHNVVKTFEVIQEKQYCYMVMEQCAGGTLRDYIAKKGRLSNEESIQIFQKILNGYRAIVDKMFIHRDLKTANILLRADGEPVIIDFGFCEMIMGKRPLIQYNVGSPAYMSPEAYGKSRYSEKSDIWALGVILHEMLRGKTPENGMEIKQYFKNIEMEQKIRIDTSEMSNLCKEILKQAFQVDPQNRATIHKLKYIIDKSQIPLMKVQLNKNHSACQFQGPSVKFRNVKPPHLNFPSSHNIRQFEDHRHLNNQNVSINLIESNKDLNSPVPVRKISFIGSKKHAKSFADPIESPLMPNLKKVNFSNTPLHNTPSQIEFEPHQPHGILRKTIDRKNGSQIRKLFAPSVEISMTDRSHDVHRLHRVKTTTPSRDPYSLRII